MSEHQDYEQARTAVLATLTPDELDYGAVYLTTGPVAAGALPGLVTTSGAFVAFVDQEPQANWGHSCRYLVVDAVTGSVLSSTARFPPFPAATPLGWRVAHRGRRVADSALLIPEQP